MDMGEALYFRGTTKIIQILLIWVIWWSVILVLKLPWYLGGSILGNPPHLHLRASQLQSPVIVDGFVVETGRCSCRFKVHLTRWLNTNTNHHQESVVVSVKRSHTMPYPPLMPSRQLPPFLHDATVSRGSNPSGFPAGRGSGGC